MHLRVLQDENFSCHSCTNCCRDWHVELMDDEIDRLKHLSWQPSDPLNGAKVILAHAGKTFIAHRADGACVFLNEGNGLCRIHETFGEAAKPLGCRLYPFQISRTFKGEASVVGRYDCPSVRRNEGLPHSNELPNLRRFAAQMRLPEGFDNATCCNLTRDQIEAVCEFIVTLMNGFERDEQRAIFIYTLGNLLELTKVDEVNREGLARIFPGLRQLVIDAIAAPVAKPNVFQRIAFRSLLGQYLRRDEDVLNHRAGRFGRAIAMTSVVLGFGSFRALGLSHQAGKLRKARLLKSRLGPHDAATFGLFWRMIRNKLDSFQFMGSANGDRNFIDGLRCLALLYPLTLAVAKYNAANRDAAQIEAQDVDHAVGAIEHSFGRSAVLKQSYARSLEKVLLEQNAFMRLVRSV